MSKGYCEKSELTAIAEAIRGKTGKTDSMALSEMPNEILAIQTGVPTQEKNVSITSNGKSEILPDEGYGLSKVSVNVAVPTDNNTKINFSDYKGQSLYIYITEIDLSSFDTTNISSMYSMFYSLYYLTSLNLSNFNTQSVTSMSSMFYYCSSLTTLDLSNFNTEKVTTMNSMFCGCFSLTSLNLSNFNTAKVTSMVNMFQYCESLTILDLSNFNTQSVISMNNMLYNCSKLITLTLGDNWASNSSITSFDLSFCPLTHDSCLDVFNKLATKTSSATLKLKSTTKALMSDDEIKIATDKGWTVS